MLGAQPLEEETSVNLSAGIAFTPVDNLRSPWTLTTSASTTASCSARRSTTTPTLAILARNGFTGIGGVQYFTNGLDTKTEGVDVTAKLRLPFAGTRSLDWHASMN